MAIAIGLIPPVFHLYFVSYPQETYFGHIVIRQLPITYFLQSIGCTELKAISMGRTRRCAQSTVGISYFNDCMDCMEYPWLPFSALQVCYLHAFILGWFLPGIIIPLQILPAQGRLGLSSDCYFSSTV